MRTPFWLNRNNLAGFLIAPIFMAHSIAPAVAGAMIIAGTSLISGIMGGMSEAKRRKQEMLMQANQQAFDARTKGAENMGRNQQSAFEQLMDTYKRTLT